MAGSTFILKCKVPREKNEEFFSWAWAETRGLLGVHEGTLLSEQAQGLGFETGSWVVDSAQAPEKRDWVGSLEAEWVELFYETEGLAEQARGEIAEKFPKFELGGIEEQKPRDWDAEWKASFTGVDLPPYWRVLPPWKQEDKAGAVREGRNVMILTPGAGFGTGTHETTQLCLEAIGEIGKRLGSLKGHKVLDFGAGSGVLSIGAAILGAEVDAVEIDELAIENARNNAVMNQIEQPIRFMTELRKARGTYSVVVANILKPVLLQFGKELVDRLTPGHFSLVLSGLIEPDVPIVKAHFNELLGSRECVFREYSRGEWRALSWVHL